MVENIKIKCFRFNVNKKLAFKHYVTKQCIPTPVMAIVNTYKFAWWKNTNMNTKIHTHPGINM